MLKTGISIGRDYLYRYSASEKIKVCAINLINRLLRSLYVISYGNWCNLIKNFEVKDKILLLAQFLTFVFNMNQDG